MLIQCYLYYFFKLRNCNVRNLIYFIFVKKHIIMRDKSNKRSARVYTDTERLRRV